MKNKRKTLTHKKEDKRQFEERNQRNHIQYSNEVAGEEENSVDGYIKTIIECSGAKQRF